MTSFRWTPGCCCGAVPDTCADLIASGVPLPRVAWGPIDNVLASVKQQAGTSNQYGWLWLRGYVSDANGLTTRPPHGFDEYRTLFDPSTGLTALDSNGEIIAYAPGTGTQTVISSVIAALRARGLEVYGLWHKCVENVDQTSKLLTGVQFDGVTPAEGACEVTTISRTGTSSYVARNPGETEEAWVNRAVATYHDVRVNYTVQNVLFAYAKTTRLYAWNQETDYASWTPLHRQLEARMPSQYGNWLHEDASAFSASATSIIHYYQLTVSATTYQTQWRYRLARNNTFYRNLVDPENYADLQDEFNLRLTNLHASLSTLAPSSDYEMLAYEY
ncbi:MAG: hypothetical protein IKE69_08145 [Thermoguttaceae bacterium]|nr:hypothetical protein [Thermoguttaceae bacterium]